MITKIPDRASEERAIANELEHYRETRSLDRELVTLLDSLVFDLRQIAQRRLWLTSTYGGFNVDTYGKTSQEIKVMNARLRKSIRKLFSEPEKLPKTIASDLWKIVVTEAHQGKWDELWAKASEIHGLSFNPKALESAKELASSSNLAPTSLLAQTSRDLSRMEARHDWLWESRKLVFASKIRSSPGLTLTKESVTVF